MKLTAQEHEFFIDNDEWILYEVKFINPLVVRDDPISKILTIVYTGHYSRWHQNSRQRTEK